MRAVTGDRGSRMSVVDIVQVIERGQDLYKWLRERDSRNVQRRLGRSHLPGLTRPEIYSAIRSVYYDSDVLTGPDGFFPVAVHELSQQAQDDPDALVGSLVRQPPGDRVHEPEIIRAIRGRGSDIWNGDTFSLARMHTGPGGEIRSIDAYLGTYFGQICSAGLLEYELLVELQKNNILRLPRRRELLDAAGSPRRCLVEGGGVDAALSISTLVVYRRGERYWTLCEVRSQAVAEYGELYHVIPSFIFQPVTALDDENTAVEWNVRHNFFREYLEELFDVPEYYSPTNALSATYFYGNANLVLLQDMLRAGTARFTGVGLTFNLLNHRAEILTLLLIDDPNWWDLQHEQARAAVLGLRHLQLNKEFALPGDTQNLRALEHVKTLPLDNPRWGREVARPWSMVPPGAPALILGVRRACRDLGREEPDWLQPFSIDPGRRSPV